MRPLRWQDWIYWSRRQITTVLLIAALVAWLLPIPVFSLQPKVGKDRSRPFPCQDRPCGCLSADQCKKQCCCFSSEEKLAWAKRNGVKASEVVSSSTKCETATLKTRKKCCSVIRVASRSQSHDRLRKSASNPVPRHKSVIALAAQQCQGIEQTLLGQLIFVVPPTTPLMPLVEPKGQRILLDGTRFWQPNAEPPVPPPRLSAATLVQQ